MDLTAILAIITGLLKFPGEIRWFIEKLQKTPQEKLQDIIGSVDKAFDRANAPSKDGKPSDDTSDVERIINGG